MAAGAKHGAATHEVVIALEPFAPGTPRAARDDDAARGGAAGRGDAGKVLPGGLQEPSGEGKVGTSPTSPRRPPPPPPPPLPAHIPRKSDIVTNPFIIPGYFAAKSPSGAPGNVGVASAGTSSSTLDDCHRRALSFNFATTSKKSGKLVKYATSLQTELLRLEKLLYKFKLQRSHARAQADAQVAQLMRYMEFEKVAVLQQCAYVQEQLFENSEKVYRLHMRLLRRKIATTQTFIEQLEAVPSATMRKLSLGDALDTITGHSLIKEDPNDPHEKIVKQANLILDSHFFVPPDQIGHAHPSLPVLRQERVELEKQLAELQRALVAVSRQLEREASRNKQERVHEVVESMHRFYEVRWCGGGEQRINRAQDPQVNKFAPARTQELEFAKVLCLV